MRRLHLALLPTLRLCRALATGFSIHEDLLAFPQFEVVFSDSFISVKDAQALVDSGAPPPPASSADHRDGLPLTYEVINMSPHRYLCSIPVVPPQAPHNETASELAKADEARELSRAVASGWSLLDQLEDSCLYFMSGWWSYRFCNNREIVQFHALSSTPSGQAPRPDPHTAEYVLGQVPAIPASSETHSRSGSDDKRVPAELQVKGDQRYLVQKLEGGTICDLTGRERTVEVQYHCSPGIQADRIGWIKEVTICAYVMVVNTPRLCDDVAFLPPEESKANPITCQLITEDGKPTPPLLDPSKPKSDDATEKAENQAAEAETFTVGGVLVGGRKVISGADQDGQPPVKLAPPRNYLNAPQTTEEGVVEVIVHAASKEDGGKIEALSAEELEQMDLKPEVIDEMREQMRKLAGDAGWQLEIVEIPGDDARELRGWVHTEEEESKPTHKAGKAKEDEGKQNKGKGKGKKGDDAGGDGQQEEKGSEEKFFKEEL